MERINFLLLFPVLLLHTGNAQPIITINADEPTYSLERFALNLLNHAIAAHDRIDLSLKSLRHEVEEASVEEKPLSAERLRQLLSYGQSFRSELVDYDRQVIACKILWSAIHNGLEQTLTELSDKEMIVFSLAAFEVDKNFGPLTLAAPERNPQWDEVLLELDQVIKQQP